MKWVKITGLIYSDQPFLKKVSVNGRVLCLVSYEGGIYAISARCPHAAEDLSRGWCERGKVVCPVHRFSYDIKSGKGSEGQNDYVDTYQVKVEEGAVYVGFETFREKLRKMFE